MSNEESPADLDVGSSARQLRRSTRASSRGPESPARVTRSSVRVTTPSKSETASPAKRTTRASSSGVTVVKKERAPARRSTRRTNNKTEKDDVSRESSGSPEDDSGKSTRTPVKRTVSETDLTQGTSSPDKSSSRAGSVSPSLLSPATRTRRKSAIYGQHVKSKVPSVSVPCLNEISEEEERNEVTRSPSGSVERSSTPTDGTPKKSTSLKNISKIGESPSKSPVTRRTSLTPKKKISEGLSSSPEVANSSSKIAKRVMPSRSSTTKSKEVSSAKEKPVGSSAKKVCGESNDENSVVEAAPGAVGGEVTSESACAQDESDAALATPNIKAEPIDSLKQPAGVEEVNTISKSSTIEKKKSDVDVISVAQKTDELACTITPPISPEKDDSLAQTLGAEISPEEATKPADHSVNQFSVAATSGQKVIENAPENIVHEKKTPQKLFSVDNSSSPELVSRPNLSEQGTSASEAHNGKITSERVPKPVASPPSVNGKDEVTKFEVAQNDTDKGTFESEPIELEKTRNRSTGDDVIADNQPELGKKEGKDEISESEPKVLVERDGYSARNMPDIEDAVSVPSTTETRETGAESSLQIPSAEHNARVSLVETTPGRNPPGDVEKIQSGRQSSALEEAADKKIVENSPKFSTVEKKDTQESTSEKNLNESQTATNGGAFEIPAESSGGTKLESDATKYVEPQPMGDSNVSSKSPASQKRDIGGEVDFTSPGSVETTPDTRTIRKSPSNDDRSPNPNESTLPQKLNNTLDSESTRRSPQKPDFSPTNGKSESEKEVVETVDTRDKAGTSEDLNSSSSSFSLKLALSPEPKVHSRGASILIDSSIHDDVRSSEVVKTIETQISTAVSVTENRESGSGIAECSQSESLCIDELGGGKEDKAREGLPKYSDRKTKENLKICSSPRKSLEPISTQEDQKSTTGHKPPPFTELPTVLPGGDAVETASPFSEESSPSKMSEATVTKTTAIENEEGSLGETDSGSSQSEQQKGESTDASTTIPTTQSAPVDEGESSEELVEVEESDVTTTTSIDENLSDSEIGKKFVPSESDKSSTLARKSKSRSSELEGDVSPSKLMKSNVGANEKNLSPKADTVSSPKSKKDASLEQSSGTGESNGDGKENNASRKRARTTISRRTIKKPKFVASPLSELSHAPSPLYTVILCNVPGYAAKEDVQRALEKIGLRDIAKIFKKDKLWVVNFLTEDSLLEAQKYYDKIQICGGRTFLLLVGNNPLSDDAHESANMASSLLENDRDDVPKDEKSYLAVISRVPLSATKKQIMRDLKAQNFISIKEIHASKPAPGSSKTTMKLCVKFTSEKVKNALNEGRLFEIAGSEVKIKMLNKMRPSPILRTQSPKATY